MTAKDDSGTPRNPNARYVDEADSRVPFGPDWEVVSGAVMREHNDVRDPVRIEVDDPFHGVVP